MKHLTKPQQRRLRRYLLVFLSVLLVAFGLNIYHFFPSQARLDTEDKYALPHTEVVYTEYTEDHQMIQLSKTDDALLLSHSYFYPLLGWTPLSDCVARIVPDAPMTASFYTTGIANSSVYQACAFGRISMQKAATVRIECNEIESRSSQLSVSKILDTTLSPQDMIYCDGAWYFCCVFTIDRNDFSGKYSYPAATITLLDQDTPVYIIESDV